MLAIAQEAAAAEAETAAQRGRAAELGALAGTRDAPGAGELDAALAATALAEARAAGLLYAATHATHHAGQEAAGRLRATADAGLKFPEVRVILRQHPLPPPPCQVEIPPAAAKEIIGGFLRHWLEFDPSVHVRSGHDAAAIAKAVEVAPVAPGAGAAPLDAADPGHLTLAAVRAAAPAPAPEHAAAVRTILASKRAYDAVAALLRSEELVDAALAAVAAPEVFQQYLFPVPRASPARRAAEVVPPQDTFHRWAYYTEVNYEELRTVTEALYPERPDLDLALAIWEVFEGTRAEVDAAFDKHCQRFQDEVPSSIRALELGSWSLLADFKENRNKIQFYNKNTEVLKRILDRHADDKRIGAELMRDRVRQAKARNIAEEGPDAPGLKEYRRNVAERGQDLGAKGVERVISAEEMKRLEKARGSIRAARELELLEQTERTIADLGAAERARPLTAEERRDLDHARAEVDKIREMVAVPDDAIQVDVFTTDGLTGTMSKSHFYTRAEAPEHLADPGKRESGAGTHPAVAASAARQRALDENRPLAPYALEHILESGHRSPDAMRAEALQDADAAAARAAGGL